MPSYTLRPDGTVSSSGLTSSGPHVQWSDASDATQVTPSGTLPATGVVDFAAFTLSPGETIGSSSLNVRVSRISGARTLTVSSSVGIGAGTPVSLSATVTTRVFTESLSTQSQINLYRTTLSYASGAAPSDVKVFDQWLVVNTTQSAPQNTVLPTTGMFSGLDMVVGSTIWVTSHGTWLYQNGSAATYQWRRNGSNIGGATAQTYQLTTSDLDAMIDCVVGVTGYNGTSATAATSQRGPVRIQNRIRGAG